MAQKSPVSVIAEVLLEQRNRKVERGFYWENQIAFAYNSEKMEGNPLTKDQTRSIFETRTVSGRAVPNDSVVEMSNHFRMFDHMLNTLGEPLTADLMQQFHRILKTGTVDDWDNPDFVVGGWKLIENAVDGIETTHPKDVDFEVNRLLGAYDGKQDKSYRDIAGFHVFFERIHPFQDGNGRIGRIIMFRECIKNDLIPFIVLDEEKDRYYQGLREFDNQPTLLTGFFEDMADLYLEAYSSLIPEHLLLPQFEQFLNKHNDYAEQAEIFFNPEGK